jgi:hypothetical protein
MAIDRIPGVGPQNTDIATAVAAAVPTIAAITSSITTNAASAGLTNASITSAGNAAGWGATGPTTTQIAAAVPTLAQITSAITTNAAPASVTMAAITSSIVSNAASAGVTNASIAATVAANAGSPYAGTFTAVYDNFVTGSAQVTISGLSGYKYLRVMVSFFNSSPPSIDNYRFYLNGDTGGNYNTQMVGFQNAGNGSTSNVRAWSNTGTSGAQFAGNIANVNNLAGTLEISNNLSSNNAKTFEYWGGGIVGNLTFSYNVQSKGWWKNTAVISSITLENGGSGPQMGIIVMGAN